MVAPVELESGDGGRDIGERLRIRRTDREDFRVWRWGWVVGKMVEMERVGMSGIFREERGVAGAGVGSVGHGRPTRRRSLRSHPSASRFFSSSRASSPSDPISFKTIGSRFPIGSRTPNHPPIVLRPSQEDGTL